MKKSLKIKLIKQLVARGEIFSAKVCCFDWSLDYKKVVGNESKSKKSR